MNRVYAAMARAAGARSGLQPLSFARKRSFSFSSVFVCCRRRATDGPGQSAAKRKLTTSDLPDRNKSRCLPAS